MTGARSLERGAMVVSLDFELIWGTIDLFGAGRFRHAVEVERAMVVDRLLDLFVRHDIAATWCIVGHLFLERCEAVAGVAHPDIVRPRHDWVDGDWLAHDPCGSEASHPLHYGRSLVRRIQACPVRQEIGSHSFSHVVFGDTGCSRAAADSDLAACRRHAEELDVTLRSFAFPRNRVGHLDVVAEHGFTSYRAPEPAWYDRPRVPEAARRAGHLLKVLSAWRPPVTTPSRTAGGLCRLPASMMYFPMHGRRRWIPASLRVRRALRGLADAAAQRKVFHMWFHPTNMADEADAMFAGLDRILSAAADLRRRGELDVLTMEELAARAA